MIIRWTPEEDAILIAGRAAGDSYLTIAKRVGKSKNACIGRAMKLHLGDVRRARQETDDATLCDFLADGGTIADAAVEMGVTAKAARKRFARIRADMGWQAA